MSLHQYQARLRQFLSSRRPQAARRPKPFRRRLLVERLEDRTLPSVSLAGIPDWLEQGPRPIVSSSNQINVIAAPGNGASGAIEGVATRPIPNSNLFQIYVATANGGVWRTDNADPTNPGNITWTPLGDQQTTLAMSSIAYSPLDASGNTLFVGTGSFSNNGNNGGPAIGVMRTTNGGGTWAEFPLVVGGNQPLVKTVLPTRIDLDSGAGVQEMVLVGTLGNGLYRSDDNGQTYTNISGLNNLPNGSVTQLISDPNNDNQFYAAVAGQGVFQGLFNAGTGVITWTAVDAAGLTNAGTSGDIQIAAFDDGANTVVFALVVGSAPGNQGAFRSVNGGNWTALAQPPAIFANPNDGSFFPGPSQSGFAIIADPTNSQVAYIDGYSSGDHIYRYDPSGSGSWQVIMAGGGGPTRPHPDGRGMTFLDNQTLMEISDGGIYFLPNPSIATAAVNNWQSFNGSTTNQQGIGATEMHDMAWDSLFDVIVGAAQDNGSEVQQSTGSMIWTAINGGDGGDVAIDDVTLAGAGRSIRYLSTQNMNGLRRVVFDSATNIVQNVTILPGGGLTNFTGLFVPNFEVNSAPPAANTSKSLVVGGRGTSPVYEATMPDTVNSNADVTWTAVAVPAGLGFNNTNTSTAVTSFVLGGRRNGVDDPNILWAGTNNGNVLIRTTAGGSLAVTSTAFPGGNVRDIAVDPEDWQHAFVISSTGVWETTDMGANWVNRTGSGGTKIAGTNLQTVEYAEAGAVDAVLVGGQGGVFRMITSNPGVWSEYGQFMPNALVSDLDYDFGDNVVVAGTVSRGGWKIVDARDTLTVPAVLQIAGDTDFSGEDDTIRLVIDVANNSLLDVFLNGSLSQFQLSTLQQINVNGLGGNDTLIVDSSNGLINVANGIRYDGGAGFDRLNLEQTGGPTHTSSTYSLGNIPGSGTHTIVGAGAGNVQTVSFENLEPVLDLVPTATLTVNATPTDNAINYTTGSLVTRGLVTIDEHESIEFVNKTSLVINALAGVDIINLNKASPTDGLTSITVNGGDPTSGDTLIVNGSGDMTVATATNTVTGAGPVSISYATVEGLTVNAANNNLTVSGSNSYTYTPGAAADAGSIQTNSIPIAFTGVGSGKTLGLTGSGGGASLLANGTNGNDTFTVDASGKVTLTGRAIIDPASIPNLTLNGLDGNDTVGLTGDGGALTADLSAATAVVSGAGLDSGLSSVVLSDIAVLNLIAGAGDISLIGSPGADSFIVTTGGTTTTTRTGETGPTVTATNTGAVTVDGGSASSNQLKVVAPGSTLATYTPGSASGGTLIVGGKTVNLSNIQNLVYDGQAGDDSLTVKGTTGNDSIVVNPGEANDAGTVAVNSTLPVAFQNLGSGIGTQVMVDGNSGNDALTYNGTAANDAFFIGLGRVDLNARVPLLTANIPTLTLQGLAGDDAFTVVPAILDDVYTTLNLHGGDQASAAGDQANLTAKVGTDVSVSGQTVSQGGNTMAGSGLENINLNGADNHLFYNGIAGVAENVNVIASPTTNAGQVSVPGVTLVTFVNVPILDVNGNSSDSDTLTFTATNNPDVLQINLAAAGTDADPILKLQDASATTLLTLRNYTGFSTLNVSTLDGADTINVYTAATGSSRNLFVDGGLSSGKKKETDVLNVFYTPKRPKIIQSTATQDPDTGLVSLDYDTVQFLIQYTGIENVVIRKT